MRYSKVDARQETWCSQEGWKAGARQEGWGQTGRKVAGRGQEMNRKFRTNVGRSRKAGTRVKHLTPM